jgi:hypothetical protein
MHSKKSYRQRHSRQRHSRQRHSRQRHSRQRHSRQRHSRQRHSQQKGGWGFFRRKQSSRKTTLRNPFSGFFSGFRGMFRSKSKPKAPNPFVGIPEDVDPTTGRTRVVEKKSMEKFNSNKNHPVEMHLVAHPNQISPRPKSIKSRPQSMKSKPKSAKSANHSKRSVAI